MKRSSSRSAAVGSRWWPGKAIGSVGRVLRILHVQNTRVILHTKESASCEGKENE